MSDNCVFCKIINGVIKEEFLYEDENLIVVRDIEHRTPTHLLVITKQHFDSYSHLVQAKPELVSQIGVVVERMVDKLNIREISPHGYTWGFHCGGKESVSHVHAQLLAQMDKDQLVL